MLPLEVNKVVQYETQTTAMTNAQRTNRDEVFKALSSMCDLDLG